MSRAILPSTLPGSPSDIQGEFTSSTWQTSHNPVLLVSGENDQYYIDKITHQTLKKIQHL